MEVVVIGMESNFSHVAETLRQRGIRVVRVPGNATIVYKFSQHGGFQELDGREAERYISSLLEPYFTEHH